MNDIVFVPGFLSTLSLRRATPGEHHANSQQEFLSTLSLRRATPATSRNNKHNIFLSTLSLRRATAANGLADTPPQISIHALLAESDQIRQTCREEISISIHALLAESDRCKQPSFGRNIYFYPRSPCGERRWIHHEPPASNTISIHALLAESDIPYQRQIDQKSNFYPRSPCGERRACVFACSVGA